MCQSSITRKRHGVPTLKDLSNFFNVNDIAEGKKSDCLVSVMGSETYGLLKNLMAPTKPSTKPFSELVKTLGDHLDPQPTEMGERFRCGRRIQNDGESVASFVAELRRLSLHCGYGENLSTALRDQFVLGLCSEATQKKLVMIRRVHQMSAAKQNVSSSDSCDDYEWSDGLHTLDVINQLSKPKNRTNMIWVSPRVAGQPLKMEVDTGSAYSVIPLSVYKEMFQKQELQPTSVTLQTYMGELVVPVGKLRVKVQYKQQKAKLDLYVI